MSSMGVSRRVSMSLTAALTGRAGVSRVCGLTVGDGGAGGAGR